MDGLGVTEEELSELEELIDDEDYPGPVLCNLIIDKAYATCAAADMQSYCCATCTQ